MSHLHELGWNSFFQQHIRSGKARLPARVVEEQRSSYRVACEAGELLAEASGQLRHSAMDRSGLPAVGDWVLIEPRLAEGRATIHEVLPRKSKFSRKIAGHETVEQIAAANVDFVFVMTSLNAELNVRRIERYLTAVWEGGAQPVIVLSKADLCVDVVPIISALSEVAFGVPVHALSAVTGDGVEQLGKYRITGRTAALCGSSGVGKSTLINRLLGSGVQEVREIRDDARGRHTTTARRLFLLPDGGMLIDTPGMRELQLWNAGTGLSQSFDDIEAFAEGCRYRDCSHESEPQCAVRSALTNGEISPGRLENYLKLNRELEYLARKNDALARIKETRRWKSASKSIRELYKNRDKP